MTETEAILLSIEKSVENIKSLGDPRQKTTLNEAARDEGKYSVDLIRALSWLSAHDGEGFSVEEIADIARDIMAQNPNITYRGYYATLTKRVSYLECVKKGVVK